MAKPLNINFEGKVYPLAPEKVERKKIYGWTELRALASDGTICRQASLSDNGQTIIPAGAIKIGALKDDGTWMDKSELVAIHSDGTPAELIPSSFDSEIKLDNIASNEDLLDLIVTSVYQLNGENAGELAAAVGDRIYVFQFSYRGGYEPSLAYLLSNGSMCFILAGEKALFDFVGLEEQGVLDELDNDEVPVEEDELDFSMM